MFYIKKKMALATFSVVGFFCCNAQQNPPVFGIDETAPVSIVKTGDRVPLYPSNGFEKDARNLVYPNVVPQNGILNVFVTRQFDVVEVVSGNGVYLMQENIKGRTGRIDIPIRSGMTGINYVRLRNKDTMIIQKFLVTE